MIQKNRKKENIVKIFDNGTFFPNNVESDYIFKADETRCKQDGRQINKCFGSLGFVV